jgi:hypothetical protein
MSKLWKGVKYMVRGGAKTVGSALEGAFEVGFKAAEGTLEAAGKLVDGEPGQAVGTLFYTAVDTTKEGLHATKNVVVNSIDTVYGGFKVVKGAKADVADLAVGVGKAIGGKPGGQVVRMITWSEDDDDDADDSDDDDDDEY